MTNNDRRSFFGNLSWDKIAAILAILSVLTGLIVKATTVQNDVETLKTRVQKVEDKFDSMDEKLDRLIDGLLDSKK